MPARAGSIFVPIAPAAAAAAVAAADPVVGPRAVVCAAGGAVGLGLGRSPRAILPQAKALREVLRSNSPDGIGGRAGRRHESNGRLQGFAHEQQSSCRSLAPQASEGSEGR